MEPSEEVLVVIQAESGEEIALPLAALDEQHQEVVVESNGISSIIDATDSECNHSTVLQQNHNLQDGQPIVQHEPQQLEQNQPPSQEDGNQQLLQLQQQIHADLPHEQVNIQIISPQNQDEQLADERLANLATVQETPLTESIPVPRQKQKRKEKLVCLPLSDEDLKLEFQFVEEPPQQVQEEIKRKPRKEYRTKKKLAALEAAKEKETNISNGLDKDLESDHNAPSNITIDEHTNTSINSSQNNSSKRRRVAKDDKPIEVAQSPPKHQRQRDKSPQQKQHNPNPSLSSPVKNSDGISKCQTKLDATIELAPQALKFDQTPAQTDVILPERRTRLSNVCRVATGKSYRCHDCGYSTERINNISLHIKKACPKLFANQ